MGGTEGDGGGGEGVPFGGWASSRRRGRGYLAASAHDQLHHQRSRDKEDRMRSPASLLLSRTEQRGGCLPAALTRVTRPLSGDSGHKKSATLPVRLTARPAKGFAHTHAHAHLLLHRPHPARLRLRRASVGAGEPQPGRPRPTTSNTRMRGRSAGGEKDPGGKLGVGGAAASREGGSDESPAADTAAAAFLAVGSGKGGGSCRRLGRVAGDVLLQAARADARGRDGSGSAGRWGHWGGGSAGGGGRGGGAGRRGIGLWRLSRRPRV